ncbi:MAG: hypothetical protein LQ352_005260 [Teloschistes flavicans]|nr:MAG: hypothetical protein LQ352_005260 [Teloschistes flavicans]
MTVSKISVYSLSDLKNTTDDALPNYLTSLKFKQSHFLTDVRLGLGYSAVAIAGITFYADHKLGWDATKYWTLLAVVAYFILNGALTYWIWGVEKGKIFTGEINDTLISIASSVNKHKPIYNLRVRYEEQGKKPRQLNISAPFTRWFDSDGYFVATPFQQWLASEIPVIGEAVPEKVASSTAGMESNKESGKLKDTVDDTGGSQQPNGASPSTAARSRKSKKTHS